MATFGFADLVAIGQYISDPTAAGHCIFIFLRRLRMLCLVGVSGCFGYNVGRIGTFLRSIASYCQVRSVIDRLPECIPVQCGGGRIPISTGLEVALEDAGTRKN